jgi:hypothetical protein
LCDVDGPVQHQIVAGAHPYGKGIPNHAAPPAIGSETAAHRLNVAHYVANIGHGQLPRAQD